MLCVCLVVVVLPFLRCRVLRACFRGDDLTPVSLCDGDLNSNFQFVFGLVFVGCAL